MQRALWGEEADDPGQSGLGGICSFSSSPGTRGIGVAIELSSRIMGGVVDDPFSCAAFDSAVSGWHYSNFLANRGEGKEGSQDKVLQHK